MLVAVALASFLAVAALAVWARLEPAAPWELALVVAAEQPPGAGRELVLAVNTLGNLPIWTALVAAIAFVVGRLRGLMVGLLAALTLLADAAAFAVKLLVERARPATVATEHYFGIDAFAFPSGHVVRAVALVAVLAWLLAPPGRRLSLALLAALVAGTIMGFARVSLGVHWPTDALGGLLLGIGWLALTAMAFNRWRAARNENVRPATSSEERMRRDRR